MKNLVFLAVFLSNFAFSQQTINEVIYKKRFVGKHKKLKDTVQANQEMLKEVQALMEESEKLAQKINYILVFNEKKSLFEMQDVLNISSKQKMSFLVAKLIGNMSGKYYIDIAKDSISHQNNFRTDLFRISSKVSDLNWKINFDSVKKVGGYTCYKATGVKTMLSRLGNIKEIPIVAWFTVELPFPFGPAEFAGLPGLILELKTNKTIIYADKITLNKKLLKKEKGVRPLKKGIKMTKDAYFEMEKSGENFYKKSKR